MTENQTQIRPEPEVIRVKFGPADHQEIRLSVAEAMLSDWRDRDPKRFGDALQTALIGGPNGHGGRS
jgi:hypothetical protein